MSGGGFMQGVQVRMRRGADGAEHWSRMDGAGCLLPS